MGSQNEAEIRHPQHHFFSEEDSDEKNKTGDMNYEKMVRGKILGVDFGISRVGLAMAEMETKIAFVYGELNNNGYFFEKLEQIIKKENINQVVLGELGYSGKNKKAFEIREIGEKINKMFEVKVEYQEEMFTTKMAQNNLKEKGEKNIKNYDNAEAARIILQSWLEKA